MTNLMSVDLPDEISERLDRLSARTKRPASVYVREALEEHLDDLEDYYLGMEALARYRENPVAYTSDEVRQRLGLDA